MLTEPKIVIYSGLVVNEFNMTIKKVVRFNTTIGELVEAIYDAAMEEYMHDGLAKRIAMQLLLRILRKQHKLRMTSKDRK